jgi:hypothetical protein
VAGRNEAAHARQVVLPVLAGPGRPSALFAVTQTMTIGALQSLWEAGLELPKDISLRKASLRRSRLADGNAGRTQGNALREVRR